MTSDNTSSDQTFSCPCWSTTVKDRVDSAMGECLRFAFFYILQYCSVTDIASLVAVSRSAKACVKDICLQKKLGPKNLSLRDLVALRLTDDAVSRAATEADGAESKRRREVDLDSKCSPSTFSLSAEEFMGETWLSKSFLEAPCTRSTLEKIFNVLDSSKVIWDHEHAGTILRKVGLFVVVGKKRRVVRYSCIIGPLSIETGKYSLLYSDRQVMLRSIDDILPYVINA